MPEDLDYYDGLLGQQPGADRAVRGGEEEAASTSDYPIPLPSYLLLALATVLSIAFTGSIFEVTGGHPEVSLVERGGGGFCRPLLRISLYIQLCNGLAVVLRSCSLSCVNITAECNSSRRCPPLFMLRMQTSERWGRWCGTARRNRLSPSRIVMYREQVQHWF